MIDDSQDDRGNRRDDGTDIGNVVEQEGDESPQERILNVRSVEQNDDESADSQAHERFNCHITANIVDNPHDPRIQKFSFSQRRDQLFRNHRRF